MNDNRYLLKLIPPTGYSIYKIEFGRRHVIALVVAVVLGIVAAVGSHVVQLRAAQHRVDELRAVTAAQNAKLSTIDAQAGHLAGELLRLEKQNAEIRRAMGISSGRRSATREVSGNRTERASLGGVQSNLARLARDSERTRSETVALSRLAARILNLRRIEQIARVQMLAAVPSLIPAGAGGIASTFGYRTFPFPEFHRGVDLEADYGTIVRAAAKGVVASAGWDGGFGQKVDIDHGNGLHTWYAHLSRINVHVGETLTKGEPIAAVGSTGASTGAHLHYQVMRDGNAIDPMPFLRGDGAKVLGYDTSASSRK